MTATAIEDTPLLEVRNVSKFFGNENALLVLARHGEASPLASFSTRSRRRAAVCSPRLVNSRCGLR